MDKSHLKCKCGQLMNETEFKNHFSKCKDFKNDFKEFDSQFGELLKKYSEPKENLFIIRFLLGQYINVIDRKIDNYLKTQNNGMNGNKQQDNNVNMNMNNMNMNNHNFNNNHNLNNNNFNNNNQNIQYNNNFNNFNNNNNNNNNNYENDFIGNNNNNNNNNNFNNYNNNFSNNNNYNNTNDDIQVCQIDGSPDITYLGCAHPICKACFHKLAESNMPNMQCKICKTLVPEYEKEQILGKEEYKRLEDKFNLAIIGDLGDLIECPSCHEKNSFEPGKIDYNVRDDQNKKLSPQAAKDYALNRCRCVNCNNNFCIKCKSIPYHIGMTCEEKERHKEAKKCRYDDVEITSSNQGPDDDVCNNADCIRRYNLSCKKHLQCGHKCFGVKSETKCPPCIDPDCSQFVNIFDQNKDTYCNICFTEGLGSSPVVLLSCNHYVHYQCIKKRIENKWIGPKITFNHCLCPVCNKWYTCQQVPEIQKLLDENKKLYDQICDMALKRLKFEDLDKDPKLTDPKSKWYGQKLEYALKRLSYYMCYVCKKPYFAGRRECGDGPNVNQEDPNNNYNPKDLVCGKDANLSGVAGVTNCPKHGKEYIEYKCRFCCKIASWFCWGTTHFCEDCHKRQCNGDYISKYPKEKLPKCDKGKCEVGGTHPANGEEYALGCSICRNNEENYQNF